MNNQQFSVQSITFTFFPQPQLLSLAPNFAPTKGPTVFNIYGDMFVSSKSLTPLCYFDSVTSAQSFETVLTYKSDNLVTCSTYQMPAGEYQLSVSMNREPLEKSTSLPFYIVNTTVTSVSPKSAPNLGTFGFFFGA